MKPGFKSTLYEVLHYWLIITFAAAAFYLVSPKYYTHSSYRLNRITGEIISLEEARRQDNPWKLFTAMFNFGETYLHRRSSGPVTHETEWTRVVDRSRKESEVLSASGFAEGRR